MEPAKTLQKPTDSRDFIDEKAIKDSLFVLTPQQQAWIDYKAISGIVYDRGTDTMRKMTVAEFARTVGVSRDTLYAWRDQIPNFWERVSERRKQLGNTEWMVKMHERWKIEALTFKNWAVSEAWLINFDPSYKTPKLKVNVEHDVSDSFLDALDLARERSRQVGNVQEGEVVHAPQQLDR